MLMILVQNREKFITTERTVWITEVFSYYFYLRFTILRFIMWSVKCEREKKNENLNVNENFVEKKLTSVQIPHGNDSASNFDFDIGFDFDFDYLQSLLLSTQWIRMTSPFLLFRGVGWGGVVSVWILIFFIWTKVCCLLPLLRLFKQSVQIKCSVPTWMFWLFMSIRLTTLPIWFRICVVCIPSLSSRVIHFLFFLKYTQIQKLKWVSREFSDFSFFSR